LASLPEKELLARLIYAEARGQPEPAQRGVANVVMNRMRCGSRFPTTISGVINQTHQFSSRSSTDPNYSIYSQQKIDAPNYQNAKDIAEEATSGQLTDNTSGATHYHANIFTPSWALPGSELRFTVQLGGLKFYASDCTTRLAHDPSTDQALVQVIDGYDPSLHTTAYVRNVLSKLCVRPNENSTPRTNSLIKVYQSYVYRGATDWKDRVTGKLTRDEMQSLNGVAGMCPADRPNFYEWQGELFKGGIAGSEVISLMNRKLVGAQKLPPDATNGQVRAMIVILRSEMSGKLILIDPALANQFTPDFVDALASQ
jgi:hypothetical protein